MSLGAPQTYLLVSLQIGRDMHLTHRELMNLPCPIKRKQERIIDK